MTADLGAIACPIARTIEVVGDRWALLVLRQASFGSTRFSDFRGRLGIASDVLAARLNALVAHGLLERVEYREPGSRTRAEYRLTDAGRDFQLVLAALGQWGASHLPIGADAGLHFADGNGDPVRVAVLGAGDVEIAAAGIAPQRPAP